MLASQTVSDLLPEVEVEDRGALPRLEKKWLESIHTLTISQYDVRFSGFNRENVVFDFRSIPSRLITIFYIGTSRIILIPVPSACSKCKWFAWIRSQGRPREVDIVSVQLETNKIIYVRCRVVCIHYTHMILYVVKSEYWSHKLFATAAFSRYSPTETTIICVMMGVPLCCPAQSYARVS